MDSPAFEAAAEIIADTQPALVAGPVGGTLSSHGAPGKRRNG